MVYNPFRMRQWRLPGLILALWALEFVFTIPALALFGIADPDLYRTLLWQDGYDNGFNSSPAEILYAYANHKPISVPLVWSQFITGFNVVIAVLAMFIMIVKGIMFIMTLFRPFVSFLVHGLLLGLFAYSVYAQSSPDLSDPQHPQPGAPWYITKSCSVVHRRSNYGYCQQAKASFAVTVILMILFAANFCWAIWCLIPVKDQGRERPESLITPVGDKETGQVSERSWEFEPPPTSAAHGRWKNPLTPRTLAFNRLGGSQDLPLRTLR